MVVNQGLQQFQSLSVAAVAQQLAVGLWFNLRSLYLQELYSNRYKAMMMECVLGARYLPRLAAAFGIVCLASAFFQFSFERVGRPGLFEVGEKL